MGTELRFIPACAGNSTRIGAQFPAPAVHPRVCGEQFGFAALIVASTGSSPRVRGTAAIQTKSARA